MNDLLLETTGFEPATEQGAAAAYLGLAIAVCALFILSVA